MIVLGLDNPKMYLREICHRVKEITNTEVSSAIWLASYGITQKKISACCVVQRRVDYRGSFLPTFFSKEMLVWVDDMGCEMLRKFGYSIHSETAVCHGSWKESIRYRCTSKFSGGYGQLLHPPCH